MYCGCKETLLNLTPSVGVLFVLHFHFPFSTSLNYLVYVCFCFGKFVNLCSFSFLFSQRTKMEVSDSLINKIHSSFSGGLHFAAPISSLRTNEVELVCLFC